MGGAGYLVFLFLFFSQSCLEPVSVETRSPPPGLNRHTQKTLAALPDSERHTTDAQGVHAFHNPNLVAERLCNGWGTHHAGHAKHFTTNILCFCPAALVSTSTGLNGWLNHIQL